MAQAIVAQAEGTHISLVELCSQSAMADNGAAAETYEPRKEPWYWRKARCSHQAYNGAFLAWAINGFFALFCVNSLFAVFCLNAVFSVFSCNSAFSILSTNSCFSILSTNGLFAIGCNSESFKMCF